MTKNVYKTEYQYCNVVIIHICVSEAMFTRKENMRCNLYGDNSDSIENAMMGCATDKDCKAIRDETCKGRESRPEFYLCTKESTLTSGVTCLYVKNTYGNSTYFSI